LFGFNSVGLTVEAEFFRFFNSFSPLFSRFTRLNSFVGLKRRKNLSLKDRKKRFRRKVYLLTFYVLKIHFNSSLL
jgi:predicted nucleic acid-binding OB-fold protein